jgi:hypothetical protein
VVKEFMHMKISLTTSVTLRHSILVRPPISIMNFELMPSIACVVHDLVIDTVFELKFVLDLNLLLQEFFHSFDAVMWIIF